jgi:Family of unknown function (DUF5681)
MSEDPKPSKPAGGYTIGRGRPPVESRFQPGRSGNPSGRPKGKKSISRALAESLAGSVTFQEGGRQRKMPMLEFIVRRLVNDAARGDLRAYKLVLDLMERFGEAQLRKEPFKFTLKFAPPRDTWKGDNNGPDEEDQ